MSFFTHIRDAFTNGIIANTASQLGTAITGKPFNIGIQDNGYSVFSNGYGVNTGYSENAANYGDYGNCSSFGNYNNYENCGNFNPQRFGHRHHNHHHNQYPGLRFPGADYPPNNDPFLRGYSDMNNCFEANPCGGGNFDCNY